MVSTSQVDRIAVNFGKYHAAGFINFSTYPQHTLD